jgi:galactokinase
MSEPGVSAGGRFTQLFGKPAQHHARAPGRVNLIGEHTDYNGGFVLPVAIPQATTIELTRIDSSEVRVASDQAPAEGVVTYRLGEEHRQHSWIDYVQGISAVLREHDLPVGGFDAHISSTVPLGAGLSSSASLLVALLRALRDGFALKLDDVELARLARRAETDFVGVPVGIMDQMACSLADEHHALFLDTRSLAFRRIPLPPAMGLVVVDSGVRHNHAFGEYRTRREECENACKLLGVTELRDISENELDRLSRLPPPLDRRARHVVTENARVVAAADALEKGDLATLGTLLNDSHTSMRDDYEVSVPAVDALVEAARAQPDVGGARLTGGGFGGAIVALASAERENEAAQATVRTYTKRYGGHARVVVPPQL